MSRRWVWLATVLGTVGGLGVERASIASILDHPINVDAMMDSRSPTYNFGVSTTGKVVVNGSDGSLARSLFRLPSTTWSIPAGQTLVSAKVCFYLWQDNTGSRNVQLNPLTKAFVEGTGDSTLSGDGATWLTYDGVHPWTSPGGDYDVSTSALATKSTNWFTWDITPLWNNSNLRSFGALLRMNDESNPGSGNMPRAPFTASDGASSQRPYVEVITTVPEPASLALLGLGVSLAAVIRRSPSATEGHPHTKRPMPCS